MLILLDSPYVGMTGLNLSWELLDGLAKHNGPVVEPGWALAALDADFPLDLARQPSLEAQVAALADDIAYDNHDIDDGLRSGYLAFDELLTLDFVAQTWRTVEARFPGAARQALLRELVREQIGVMVNDVLTTTRGNLADRSAEECAPPAGSSRRIRTDARTSGSEGVLYQRLYSKTTARDAERAREVTPGCSRPSPAADLLPPDWFARLPDRSRAQRTSPFVAG